MVSHDSKHFDALSLIGAQAAPVPRFPPKSGRGWRVAPPAHSVWDRGTCYLSLRETRFVLEDDSVARTADSDALLHQHQIRCSIVVSISACHAEDPGSIPGGGVLWLSSAHILCGVSTGSAQRTWIKKIVYTSRFVRVILAQGPC